MSREKKIIIDKNVLEANIKLMDDKKELMDIIDRSKRYLEKQEYFCKDKDCEIADCEKLRNDLLSILKGKVE